MKKEEVVEKIVNIVFLVLPFILFARSFIALRMGETTLFAGLTPIAITSLIPFYVVLRKILTRKSS